MSLKLQLVKYPDHRLSEVCAPVENMKAGEFDELITGMFKIMHINNGIGLAAPQVGQMIRLVIASVSGTNLALINPEITYRKGKTGATEGCLSYPGRRVYIERSKVIQVQALERNGRSVGFKASNTLARVIQHEIDHLDGICRVGPKPT